MMSGNRVIPAIASALALSVLTSCAGSPLGDTVQQSLEADPQLEETAPFGGDPAAAAPEEADTEDIEAPAAETAGTEDVAIATAPEPGDPDFIGPVPAPRPRPRPTTSPQADDNSSGELAAVPADLQAYIRDLQALNLLELHAKSANSATGAAATETSPFNQTITRREYAQWLFDSYNRLYADEPGERLRPGTPNAEPAFQDVPTTAPEFAAIQGLAEAGIIPSAWTGNSTDVTFRPDAPLTRADLILWKVPLDTRTALPQTTPEAVTQTWGFQDTASIDPLALRAIAADFQLGDFSNIRRAFGYTTLLRPDKPVTRAEAAAVLWRFGTQTEGRSAAEVVGNADAETSADRS